jgi:ligand-binding sensor domain-containing protein
MKRTLISCILLAGFSIFCLSQESEVRFHHFGVDEGLSHSLVLTIEEDSLGFLWFGTQDGLNRFNGYQFRTYFKGETKRDPSDSWIRSLFIDSYQQMWIWYNGTGLDRYDPYTETFHTYYADAEPGSISSASYTPDDIMISSDFYEDMAGNLWIGTEKGLNRYIRETDSFVSYRCDKNNPSTLSDDHIVAITGDSKGNLWIGTTNGLNRLDPVTGKVRRFMDKEGSPYHLNDYMIRAV